MITIILRPHTVRTIQLPEKPDYLMGNWRISARHQTWRPPTDVYETETQIVVRLEAAGMKESDFQISLEQNVLLIQGIRPDIAERRAFHQMEINFGEFASAIEIPAPIDIETVSAEYKNGLLWIYMNKTPSIQIQVNE